MNVELLRKSIVMAFIILGVGYIIFPPFYEEGVWRIIVPLIGVLDFVLAYDLFSKKFKLQNYYRGISIGFLIIGISFFGQSNEYYGNFTIPMMLLESIGVVGSILLLIYSFKYNVETNK